MSLCHCPARTFAGAETIWTDCSNWAVLKSRAVGGVCVELVKAKTGTEHFLYGSPVGVAPLGTEMSSLLPFFLSGPFEITVTSSSLQLRV